MYRILLKTNKYFVSFLFSVLFGPDAYGLDELGVVGQVTKAAPFYTQFINKSTSKSIPQKPAPAPSNAQASKFLQNIYNYDSGLSAGTFQRYYHELDTKYAYQTPICLIANDDYSIKWLKKKAATLKKANAVCYLVRNTQGEADSIRKKFPALQIYTVNPRFIIQVAKIPHYPAVLSKKGVEQ